MFALRLALCLSLGLWLLSLSLNLRFGFRTHDRAVGVLGMLVPVRTWILPARPALKSPTESFLLSCSLGLDKPGRVLLLPKLILGQLPCTVSFGVADPREDGESIGAVAMARRPADLFERMTLYASFSPPPVSLD